jgi:hypothetical protein
MVKRGPMDRSAYAAALLAVALFGFAFTQSGVMQVSRAMPGMTMIICTAQGPVKVSADSGVPKGKSQNICPYCAAAAHAPLCASIEPIAQSSAVAWTAYLALRPLGPRGPPARAPNARGPPPAILTI